MNKKESQKADWFEFYKNRVESASYLEHFRNKYGLLIALVKSFSICGLIKEEGIGIGTLSKVIGGNVTYGSDICERMLMLCRANNPGIEVYREDIRSKEKIYKRGTFSVVTHGVLEHFNNKDIHSILRTYDFNIKFSIHYVPTNEYSEPSFGDERLLPVQYWIDTFRPYHFLTENQEKDLYLIFKHK